MKRSEAQGFIWLDLKERGKPVAEIATETGYSRQWIYEAIRLASDWLEHRRQLGIAIGEQGYIRTVLRGIVADCRCIHGLPLNTDGTWVCADCAQTNNPDHPKLNRGRISRDSQDRKQAPSAETAAEVVAAVQPDGPAKFVPNVKQPKATPKL